MYMPVCVSVCLCLSLCLFFQYVILVFLAHGVCMCVCDQLVTETDSSCQVIGPATSAQTLNAGVVNSLYKFHQAVSKVSLFSNYCRLYQRCHV